MLGTIADTSDSIYFKVVRSVGLTNMIVPKTINLPLPKKSLSMMMEEWFRVSHSLYKRLPTELLVRLKSIRLHR